MPTVIPTQNTLDWIEEQKFKSFVNPKSNGSINLWNKLTIYQAVVDTAYGYNYEQQVELIGYFGYRVAQISGPRFTLPHTLETIIRSKFHYNQMPDNHIVLVLKCGIEKMYISYSDSMFKMGLEVKEAFV